MAVETTEVLPLDLGRQTEPAGSAGPAGPAGPARSAGDELATPEAGLDALDHAGRTDHVEKHVEVVVVHIGIGRDGEYLHLVANGNRLTTAVDCGGGHGKTP